MGAPWRSATSAAFSAPVATVVVAPLALLLPASGGGRLFEVLSQWVARAHSDAWPWKPVGSVLLQYELHPTFLAAEALFLGSAALAAWHAAWTDGQQQGPTGPGGGGGGGPPRPRGQSLRLLWLLTFVAGTANDYIFMLMPMVDNFWQGQAVLMLTPRMPLYIPCAYNAFMYWSCVAAWRLCRSEEPLPRFAEASFAALLGAVLYAPYDICGQRFLWWTWHLDDAGVKMRWAGNEPFRGGIADALLAPLSGVLQEDAGLAAPGGGVPVGSTAWTLVFTFCFAWFLRLAYDRHLGSAATTALVAGLSTLAMMALLTPLCFLAGDRLGMPGPNTLVLTISGLVLGCGQGVVRRLVWGISAAETGGASSAAKTGGAGREPRGALRPEPAAVRAFVLLFFATFPLVLLLGRPENQVSTGVHQTFALKGCSAEDRDMIEYRRLKYACREPPARLPPSGLAGGVEEATPWHARGWAHDPAVLPLVHHPREYLSFDCARHGRRGGPRMIAPEEMAVDGQDGEGPLSSWYTVCGVPSSNARALAWAASLALIGSSLYLRAFSLSLGSGHRNGSLRSSAPAAAAGAASEVSSAAAPAPAAASEEDSGTGSTKPSQVPPKSLENPDYWVNRSNTKELTRLGRFARHLFDPLVLPIVDRPGGWIIVSVGIGALLIALQAAAGAAFQAIFTFGPDPQKSHGLNGAEPAPPLLQPAYVLLRRLLDSPLMGPFGAAHPMAPSVVAFSSYFLYSIGLTALDILGSSLECVRSSLLQPPLNGSAAAPGAAKQEHRQKRFGGSALGLAHAVKSHVILQLILAPVYARLIAKRGPHLYQPPWFEKCTENCAAPLPELAPTLSEFIATFLFCLLTMDAGYGYWHFLAHRYRSVYKNVHAWHHEYQAPFALVTQHAHPIELLVTGGFSMAGPVACGAHPFSFWVWLAVSVWLSVDAHSGYDWPRLAGAALPRPLGGLLRRAVDLNWLTCGIVGGSAHHDEHHRRPCGNFAPFLTYLDALAGTELD